MTARHVYVAAPLYEGKLHSGTMQSILRDMLMITDQGDRFTYDDDLGNGDIEIVRALLVAKFLASDATDLVMIDGDIQWQPGLLPRLLDHPVDFVAAVYPHRCDPLNFSVRWLDRPELWADPETGLLEVEGVPGGCIRLRRAVLERMVEAYADSEFFCAKAPNETAWHLFQKLRLPENQKLLLSEDFSFCRRWNDIGGQVWIDPDLTLGHTGPKTFVGSIGEWLKNR